MTQEQLAALAKGLAPVVRECVATATAPLLEQIASLEKELAGVKGAASDACQKIVDQQAQDAAQIKAWMDGIEQRVAEVEARPQPKDADPAEIARMVSEAVDALPKPEDGKSVTVEDVQPLIDERVSVAVSEAVKALPAPKDGKDGVGVAGALIDRDGGLVLTLTDGTQRDLGAVVGKDGEPGKDGLDGLGFDDMDMVVADDGVALVFARGEQKKAFALPIVFDRGVFKADTAYRKGNGVTWGGQFWIAQKDNPEGKPDASSDWRLAVKKGRDAPRHVAKVEVQP